MNNLKSYRKILGAVAMNFNNPVLVSVGANDGVTADRVIPFCLKNGWKSVLIEPMPHMMDICKKNLKYYQSKNGNIYFVQCAASDHEGKINMRYVDPSIPDDKIVKSNELGKSTASEDYEYDEKNSNYVKNMIVKCKKLDDIIKERVDRVSVLSIDVEGYEPKVFAGFDVKRWKPAVIIWEIKHLSKEVRRPIMRKLSSLGYKHANYGPDCISAIMGLEKMIDGS